MFKYFSVIPAKAGIQVKPGVMKIIQFLGLFYHLESIPKIKCLGIWFQVSGVRSQETENTNCRYLTPET